MESHEICEFYGDYYEHVARSKHIRPIKVTEGVNFSALSSSRKILWCCKTVLNLLGTDRLFDCQFLSKHFIHYGGLLVFALLAWCPQVLDTFGYRVFSITPASAYLFCAFGNLYYFISISVFFKLIGPMLRKRIGVARTLRFWEFYVSVAWQGQTLAFWVLTVLDPVLEEEFSIIPKWTTTVIGSLLIFVGIFSKMGAIFGTGYNTYYWYDMVTNIPNAYYVEDGIYKFVSSPTYTLGRGTSFGAAIYYRSLPMFLAAILDLLGINIFNLLVEQPSVKMMYG